MKLIYTAYYKIKIRWIAFRWIFQINLGNNVWHKGRKRPVVNWANNPTMTLGDPYEQYVPLKECRKVWSLSEIRHSYSSGVRFFEGYWLDIWVNEAVNPHLKHP